MATQRNVLRFPLTKSDPRGNGVAWSKGRQLRRRSIRDRNMTVRNFDLLERIRRECS